MAVFKKIEILSQKEVNEREIKNSLNLMFENLLKLYGDKPEIRLLITEYTMGYMGASYGLHIKG